MTHKKQSQNLMMSLLPPTRKADPSSTREIGSEAGNEGTREIMAGFPLVSTDLRGALTVGSDDTIRHVRAGAGTVDMPDADAR